MGQPEKNLFRPEEIRDLNQQPFVEGAAPLIANQFRVQLSAGAIFAFKTDLFLESLENDFIDTVPPSFHWQEGQGTIPVIISSDFLEAYNVFAPGQGLPQISQETAGNIPIQITCSGNGLQADFTGTVVAFSDRINSVLVPKTFLDWANARFGQSKNPGSARLYIKTKDANDPALISYIDQHNYKVNKDKIKFGRTKQILQGIFTGLGLFGLLVVAMALMLFAFYLQLVIARSRENLQLLLLLGYSPKWLGSHVSRSFIPLYVMVMVSALVVTQLIQLGFHYLMSAWHGVPVFLDWSVFVIAIVLAGLSIYSNYRLVSKLLNKLY